MKKLYLLLPVLAFSIPVINFDPFIHPEIDTSEIDFMPSCPDFADEDCLDDNIDFTETRSEVNGLREELLTLQVLDSKRVSESKPEIIKISHCCDYIWT